MADNLQFSITEKGFSFVENGNSLPAKGLNMTLIEKWNESVYFVAYHLSLDASSKLTHLSLYRVELFVFRKDLKERVNSNPPFNSDTVLSFDTFTS